MIEMISILALISSFGALVIGFTLGRMWGRTQVETRVIDYVVKNPGRIPVRMISELFADKEPLIEILRQEQLKQMSPNISKNEKDLFGFFKDN